MPVLWTLQSASTGNANVSCHAWVLECFERAHELERCFLLVILSQVCAHNR